MTLQSKSKITCIPRLVLASMFLAGAWVSASAQTNTFPSSGNAGIGTTTPAYPLTINQTGNSVNRILSLANDSSGSSAQAAVSFFEGATEKFKFGMNSSGATSYVGGANAFQLWHFQNAPIVFGTNSSERMRIDGAGNVGIGTSNVSPWTAQTSVIESLDTSIFFGLDTDIGINSNAYHQSGWKYKTSDAASNIHMYKGEFYFRQAPAGTAGASLNWTTPMFITGTGKVGIGTTSPKTKFDIKQSEDSFVGGLHLRRATTNDTWALVTGNDNKLYMGYANNASGADAASDFTVYPLVLTDSGNVGIGTSTPNPSYKLDVNGEINATGFRINGTPISGGGGSVASVFGRTGAVVAATNDYTWAQINKTTSSLADITTRNAGDLNAGFLQAARMPALTGDVTSSAGTMVTALTSTGVTAGSYTNANITVDAKGRITAASNGSGGSTAFSSITAGTNTVALVVGNSGSLGVSGTGTINATSLTNAANITSGTVPIARLGTGTPDSTKFLRGDNTWTAITSSQWTTSGSNINYATAGNVGIGTASPTSKLHVTGDGKITGNLTVDGSINAKYQDLAEWVPSSEQLSAGTVVVLDTTKSNQVISSATSYDTRVAGVISAQPGITLGESGEGKVLVATTGRVRVKVDASRGPIQIGDLLVTSDVAGVAMKSEAVELAGRKMHMPGTIIGKALEPLAKGSGEILVLLSLQ